MESKQPIEKITREIEIKNFKSIKHVRFTGSRVNVFIGKPNSGKSNLLEALSLFNVIQGRKQNPSVYQSIRYATLDNLFYDRDLENTIEIRLDNNLTELFFYQAVNVFLQIVNPSSNYLNNKDSLFSGGLSLKELGAKVSFIGNTDPQRLSSMYAFFTNEGDQFESGYSGKEQNPVLKYEFREGLSYQDTFQGYLKPFGENLYAIAQRHPVIREWISDFFEEFKLEFLFDFASRKFEIQKKEKGIVYKIPFELTPDTFRRMLFHIAAIHSNKNATLLFEEPESHSFPPYIKELSELIKADKNNTYFLTTHSPYFFSSLVEDSLKYDDISFFHVYYENYETRVRQLNQSDLDNLWGSGADVFFNIDSLSK